MERFGGLSLLWGVFALGASANGLRQAPDDCREVTQAEDILDAIQTDPTLEKTFCFAGDVESCVTLPYA